jgi:hypothetical protein
VQLFKSVHGTYHLKSVLRYKFLILDTCHPDTPYLREQGCEDPSLFFEAKRGPLAQKFREHCSRTLRSSKKLRAICCLETSVSIYTTTQRHEPEDWHPKCFAGHLTNTGLRLRVKNAFFLFCFPPVSVNKFCSTSSIHSDDILRHLNKVIAYQFRLLESPCLEEDAKSLRIDGVRRREGKLARGRVTKARATPALTVPRIL